MKHTRAERRAKTALIKRRIWNRSWWAEESQETEMYVRHPERGYILVPTNHEFVTKCFRRLYRNEGKWRHEGKKKFVGCSWDCGLCNPRTRAYGWRDIHKSTKVDDKLDVDDSYETTSQYGG
jgi:hypothetical protein